MHGNIIYILLAQFEILSHPQIFLFTSLKEEVWNLKIMDLGYPNPLLTKISFVKKKKGGGVDLKLSNSIN